jgi:uncharacterized protein
MKKALIIWGGWEGHKPEITAERLSIELQKRGWQTTVTSNFGILLNEDISSYDVIVPIWSCGIQGDIYLNELLNVIKSGTGLATFHGGINWFDQEQYYKVIGGLYLYDTKPEDYDVKIINKNHPITLGQNDFVITSEKYFLQTDYTNNVLASADFSGVEMPIAWTRNYGQGRVFYTTLAHTVEELFKEESLGMILNGIDWCGRKLS